PCPPRSLRLLRSRIRRPPRLPLFPYTTLFRSSRAAAVRCRYWVTREHQRAASVCARGDARRDHGHGRDRDGGCDRDHGPRVQPRSEEHTSELQSRENLVCRLLLEKKKKLLGSQ